MSFTIAILENGEKRFEGDPEKLAKYGPGYTTAYQYSGLVEIRIRYDNNGKEKKQKAEKGQKG